MRPLRKALLWYCLTPALWPASLPAASVEARGADGSVSVQQAPTQRLGTDPVAEATERQYRAAYYYSLAQLALQRGLNADAEILLKRAQSADPGSPLLARERGELLESLGQDAQAALQLDQALQAEPEDMELRRRLARVYVRLEKVDLARDLFLGPDGGEPTDPERLRGLVGMDLAVDDLPAAEKRLRALIKAGHANADDEELLAALLQRTHRPDEAAAAYRHVLAEEPTRSTAWARLSACLDAGGDTAGALGALEDGLRAVPDSSLLADQLGRLSYRLGHFDRAEEAFGRLVEADPKDADSLLYRGLARLKLRRFADAEADFSALGALQHDSPGQAYGLALSQVLQKKYAQAETALKKVLELNPQAEPAWVQLAFLYERQGQLDRALKALKKGSQAVPGSEELTLLLSAAHAELGDKSAAVDVLRQGVRRGMGEAVRFQLAVQMDKAGDFKQAEAVLQSLIKDEPKHAQALNYLGYSWAERKQNLSEAEALIRRALEVEPDNHYYLDSLGWALHQQARDADAEAPLSKAAAALGGSTDADDAVVLDHLAAVREALGRADAAAEARAQAAAIRAAAAKAKADGPKDDGGMEP